MKRRFSAAVLALCLTLALLPAPALAAEADGTEYWVDMSAGEAGAMLNAVAAKSESRYMVFVYYDAATAQNPVEAQFRSSANKNKHYIYGYNASSGGSLVDALAPLFGGSTALTLPVAVTWNPSTKTCIAKDNVWQMTVVGDTGAGTNGLLDIMKENGLTNGSSAPDASPSDPDTPAPPDGPDDPETPPDVSGGSSIAGVSGQAWEVLRLLNIYRMERGLQPLSTFAAVQEAANIRAKELFVHCSHTRPNGTGYETVFAEVGVPALSTRITSWAENIASGQKSAADVMNSWKTSPGHNANMLKPSGRVHVGIGYDYQTNGNPSLYASNWVQNFAAAYDCCFTNLQLSRSTVEGKPGTDLETLLKEAGIEVTADCYRHGRCSLPLIAAMCRGYDAGSTAEQELTVAYGGQTAVLTVTGSGHTHSWAETVSPAACTVSGSRTLTCAGCGGTKVEVIPALGHSFALQPDGANVCASCSASVPAGWKTAYEELTEDAETNKLQYPHGEEGVDIEASEAAIQNYLERQAAAVLRNSGVDETAFDCAILDGAFNEEHTRYGYRIGITAAESPELQPFSMLRAYRAEDYILETEPLVLFLNVGSSDDSIFDEAPDVATPGGNVSVDDPSTPPEPQPPSVPSDPYVPSRPSGGTGPAAATVYQIAAPQTDGGRVSLSPSSASRGQRVTISAHPDSGYVLDSLRVTDAGGNEVPLRDLGDGTYEFTMPGSQVALTAAFKKTRTEPALNPAPLLFSDVSSADWFYSSVDYVWKHYLMSGVSGTQFAPGGTTSRAMLWTILARMHGASAGAAPGEAWYTGGQLWAVQQNISDGTAPMGDVTREQIAAMLWRDAGSPQAAADLSGFRDGGLVSGYAQAAMRWAVETGIMQGADGMLRPQSTATRAEMAAMITRYAVQAG